jgi:hypothetical protein
MSFNGSDLRRSKVRAEVPLEVPGRGKKRAHHYWGSGPLSGTTAGGTAQGTGERQHSCAKLLGIPVPPSGTSAGASRRRYRSPLHSRAAIMVVAGHALAGR